MGKKVTDKQGVKRVSKRSRKAKAAGLPGEKVLGVMTNTEHLRPGGIKRTRSKVAIVGFADSSMGEVARLFDDPDFEIWPLNQLYMKFPAIVQHATRWFQIHSRKSYDEAIRDHKHSEWLGLQRAFPIYMQEVVEDIPMSCKFPMQSIMAKFGDYFTNSISWMIALAIYEKFEEIHIYGVDMAQDDEYSFERPSVEYFLGLARGMGIKVHVPDNSDLLKAFWLYPFEDDVAFESKIRARVAELRSRAAQLAGQEQMVRDQRMQLLGAADNMNYIRRNWRGQIKEMRMGAEGKRPRVDLLTGKMIDEEAYAEAEAKLREKKQ